MCVYVLFSDVKVMLARNYTQTSQTQPDTINLHQLAAVATGNVHANEPWLEIQEEPKSKGIRFRYKCEGRSAGSIPGESSSNEHKTFPSVKVCAFNGRVYFWRYHYVYTCMKYM